MLNKYTDAWDNRVERRFAHLEKRESLFSLYKNRVADRIDLEDSLVLDFGCGGGWLGVYLSNINCSYRGVDISKRSIETAKMNYIPGVFALIDPYRLSNIRNSCMRTVLVSLSVIQHFPSVRYLDYFLCWINNNNFDKLVLQIRYGAKTHAVEDSYKTVAKIIKSMYTNSEYISEKLTNYKLFDISSIFKKGYQYLYYEKTV